MQSSSYSDTLGFVKLLGPLVLIFALVAWGTAALVQWALSSWLVLLLLAGGLAYLYRSQHQYQIPRELIDAKSKQGFKVCVVGAGFAGIGMGVKLKSAGIPFVIIEKGSRVGGTWRDNQYPGVAVDIFSYSYQFSYYISHKWSSNFSPGKEILSYLEECSQHFGLTQFIRYEYATNK